MAESDDKNELVTARHVVLPLNKALNDKYFVACYLVGVMMNGLPIRTLPYCASP